MDWLLERFAQADPALTAFVHKGQVCTYGRVSQNIESFAAELISRGVQPGQTVVVLADYAPDVFCMILALASLRCIVVPMTRGSVIEEGEALSISGCDFAITFAPDGLSWTLEPRSIPAPF